ncbi:zinc ABC transporter substrate-binding protein, partial [Streptomyces sp. NPDC002812]
MAFTENGTVVPESTALTACSGTAGAAGAKDGKLDVMASFYPMQF